MTPNTLSAGSLNASPPRAPISRHERRHAFTTAAVDAGVSYATSQKEVRTPMRSRRPTAHDGAQAALDLPAACIPRRRLAGHRERRLRGRLLSAGCVAPRAPFAANFLRRRERRVGCWSEMQPGWLCVAAEQRRDLVRRDGAHVGADVHDPTRVASLSSAGGCRVAECRVGFAARAYHGSSSQGKIFDHACAPLLCGESRPVRAPCALAWRPDRGVVSAGRCAAH